jgi:hypothetical protein
MSFREAIFGERRTPEGELNPKIAYRIINYFKTAATLNPEELKPESPNNPLHKLTEDMPLAKGDYYLFLESLAKGDYDEISVRFFTDIIGEYSPLALSKEKKLENLHQILIDPVLKKIESEFKSHYWYGEHETIDPEEIEKAKQELTGNSWLGRSVPPEKQKTYADRFRDFLYIHFGPAMAYSEQYSILLEEAKTEFPRPTSRQQSSPPYQNGFDPYDSIFETTYFHHKQAQRESPPPKTELPKQPSIQDHLKVLGLSQTDIEKLSANELDTVVRQRYRRRAFATHPDYGGQNKEMVALNNARDELRKIIKEKAVN